MRRLALLVIGVAFPFTVAGWQDQRAVFRTETRAIVVDVSVTDGRGSVPNLTTADFEILDNGVKQTLTDLDYGRLPIDVRILFDTSGSVSTAQLERFVHAMNQVGATLQTTDRAEVWAFASRSVDVMPLREPPVAPVLSRIVNDGTSFFDAVGMAMITTPRPGRRQLTIVLSDGLDTSSFFDQRALMRAAQRTDAVVYTVQPRDRMQIPAIFTSTSVTHSVTFVIGPKPASALLESLSSTTGGRLLTLDDKGDIGSSFLKALEEFRQSYVLRYTPQGVARTGWHALSVAVKGRKYSVRARQGYDGGR